MSWFNVHHTQNVFVHFFPAYVWLYIHRSKWWPKILSHYLKLIYRHLKYQHDPPLIPTHCHPVADVSLLSWSPLHINSISLLTANLIQYPASLIFLVVRSLSLAFVTRLCVKKVPLCSCSVNRLSARHSVPEKSVSQPCGEIFRESIESNIPIETKV